MRSEWAERGREWRREQQQGAADAVDPWEYGTFVRSHRYPDIWDLNAVVIERPSGLSAIELVKLCDREFSGSAHGKIDVEDVDEGLRLRPELEALGWKTAVLVWMVFVGDLPDEPGVLVEEVPYDSVDGLRWEWHQEDFPGTDPSLFHAELAELQARHRARVLSVREDDHPVAYSLVEVRPTGSEVGEVFVTASHRGRGLGTAVTVAAMRAGLAASPGELWITADDEARAWPLYERLGFRKAWRMVQFLRLPGT